MPTGIEKTWASFMDKFLDFLPNLVTGILILVIGFWFCRLIVKIFMKMLIRKKVDESVHTFLKTIVDLGLKTIIILTVLSTIGINVNSIVAAFGAAGLAAGIGFKDSIAQLASGMQILVTKPFKKGDFIELENISGNVDEIQIMNTTLHTVDNKTIIIPNSHFTTNYIINYYSENSRRVDLTFQISYADDIILAKQLLLKLAEESPLVLQEPKPIIGVKEHGASGIYLDDKIWCKSDDYWDLYYDMQEKVKIAFEESNISIPYNQMDIHIVSDTAK